MEGKGVTAEQSPLPGENGEQDQQKRQDATQAYDGKSTPSSGANSLSPGNEPNMSSQPSSKDTAPPTAPDVPGEGVSVPAEGASGPGTPPRVRVDARLLEATLLNLHKRIAAIPLVLDIPGTDDISAERAKLLSQIDDYLLPRVRQSGAPLLVALVGSTGAGKSTLVNSIVGTQVSLTGVRRPTTNSPVLACHPDDIHWFAENMFLPTLPRVRQEGLARARARRAARAGGQ